MSRRKQARPRLIKREDEDDDGIDETSVVDKEPDKKKCKLNVEVDTQNCDDTSTKTTTTTEIFRCESCGATFKNLLVFMDHKNTRCEEGLCAQKRTETGNGSNTPSSVDSQCSPVSLPESPLPDIDSDKVPFSTEVSDKYPVSCQHCEKTFPSLAFLRVHEQTHRDNFPFSCGACIRVFKSRHLRDRHASTHKNHKCTQCDAIFSRSENLKNHMKLHEIQEVYPCQICDLEYPTMAALMSHQNAHKPKHTYTRDSRNGSCCHDCGDVFFTDKDKENHTCPSFGGKRTFQCLHCTAICVGPTALALHCEHAHSSKGVDQNKCPLCFKCFLTLDELTAHMKIHDLPNPEPSRDPPPDYHSLDFGASMMSPDVLVCPYCFRDDFETLEGLELHMQSMHSVKPTEVYTCNYCNAPYKNLYSLHEHMRAIHQNQPSMGIKYPCSKCGKEYPSIESLQEHKKRVHYKHKQNDNAHVCCHCSLAFVSASALYEHTKASHSDIGKRVEDRSRLKTPKFIPQSKSPCPPVPRPTSREYLSQLGESQTIINVPEPSHLLRHLRSPVKTEVGSPNTVLNGATFSVNHLTVNHLNTSPSRTVSSGGSDISQENITCDQCNAVFLDGASYQAHAKMHIDSMLQQFGCRQCQKLFISEEQLECHLSTHFLSASSEYGCKSCDKTFHKPDELQKHLMDIHAHHLYKCSLCKETYDSKVDIQVHFAIKHSNECKLYGCVACDVIYRSESEWQLHLRVKHLHLAKPYRCLFCKESFSTEMDLQCHLATHNKPFKCSMCDETFLVEFLLDKHLQNVHAAGVTGMSSPSKAIETTGVTIKQEKGIDVIKQEPETSSMLFNTGARTSPGAQPPMSIIAGNATIMGDGNQLFHNFSGISVGGFLDDGGSPLFQSGMGSSGPGSGSMVWKSPEDLYRCNICDMKFSQLTGLQNHKLHDHGLKYVNPGKYSPSTSPKQSMSTNCDSASSMFSELLSRQNSDSTSSTSTEKQTTSLLQDALTSSFGLAAGVSSDSASNAFSEKLISTFGEKLFLACPFCSQTFKCKADLEKHSKIHLNTGSQKCNICDEVFASTGILAEHKLTHCKIQQGNICVACKISIKSEEQFYLHSQEHGFQGAVMQCIVCRQTLASMLELQMHGRHHFQNKITFHTCCVCLNSFDSNENLISKLNSSGRTYYVCKPCYHGDANVFPCNQCGAKFSSQSALEIHIPSHKKSYQCIKCQESFSSEQEIQIHVTTHMMTEGNVHECFLCFMILDSPAKLQCHLIEHTFKNAEFTCHMCGRTFNSATEIQCHALEHGVSARKHACDQCNQKFFFSAELENHKYIHKRMSAPTMFGKSGHSQSLTIQPLSWQTLDDSPSNEAQLNYASMFSNKLPSRHSPLQEGEYSCSKCDKKYNSIYELAEHLKSAHSKVEKNVHRCPSCPEMFSLLTQLQTHFFLVHTKPDQPAEKTKPKYACSMCDKECSSEHNLLTHMNTHRKGERHTCSQCNRTFSTSSGLQIHVTTKCHGVPHECPICHKRFAKKTAKMEHMKTHSGDKVYPCTTCGTLFTNKGKLEDHMAEHELQHSPTSESARGLTDDDVTTDSRSGTSEETLTPTGNPVAVCKDGVDGETDGMKQEVSSTSNIPDDEIADSK